MKHYDGTGRGPGRASVADCLVSTGERISLLAKANVRAASPAWPMRLSNPIAPKLSGCSRPGAKILTTTFTLRVPASVCLSGRFAQP